MSEFKTQIEKADTLIEALPYIKKFAGKTIVIKHGGSVMGRETASERFAEDVSLLKMVGVHPIIVHGGGNEISEWMKRLGKEPRFIEGLRVTDAESMQLTEMVLSGKINRELVTVIGNCGARAVGLSGKDGNLFTAQKLSGTGSGELGFVGEIVETNTGLLSLLCSDGYIPVIASVATGLEGETLNINADHVAAAIAVAMKAEKLVYLTDVPGITIDGNLQSALDLEGAEKLLHHKDVTHGMRPKLRACIKALKGGVSKVHVLDGRIEHSVLLELFTDAGVGTMFTSTLRSNIGPGDEDLRRIA